MGLPVPGHRRWPIRIDLSDFGDAIAGGEPVSLLQFIAAAISRRAPTPVTAAQLLEWLGRWPWLLVLDGLDEVATPSVREGITEGVSDFLVDAAGRSADVLLVVTTRPQGYAGEFGASDYQRLELQPLDIDKALECAERLGEQRLADDEDLRAKVHERIVAAANDPNTVRLLRTPLQVAIMQILLERRQRVPHGRYQLFEAYFDAIYAREQNKPGWLGHLLEDHRRDIIAIHEQVALLLQQQAEAQGQHEASIAGSELHRLSRERLMAQGHEEEQAAELAEKLVRAATHRLVLLVGVVDSDVAYEIRSLREFMAARALTTGPDEAVLRRLAPLVPSAHWRNTWLFAAGRLFVDREHLGPSVVTLLRQTDAGSLLDMLASPGAELATDLLDDDAMPTPLFRRLLAEQAVDRVSALPDGGLSALANALFEAASGDSVIRARVDHQIDLARAAGGGQAVTAHALLTTWSRHTGGLAAHARRLLGSQTGRTGSLQEALHRTAGKDTLTGPSLRAFAADLVRPDVVPDDERGLDELLADLEPSIQLLRPRTTDQQPPPTFVAAARTPDMASLERAFSRTGVADAYAQLVAAVPGESYQVASALKDVARYWHARRPVAHLLI
jgi:hypothetical protein